VAYLLLTGVLLGYLAERDKESRTELEAIAAASRQPQIDLGLGGSVIAVARTLLDTFGAEGVAVVVHDDDTGRTLLWQLDATPADGLQASTRPLELSAQDAATWLFDDWGRSWHATRSANGGGDTTMMVLRVTEPETWPLKRERCDLPATFVAAKRFTTVTTVNIGLAGEWHARAYLFDVRWRGGLEERLHFLEQLADHVTPGLTNVFLSRRLGARAGAAERARVARELHDGAIQALFGIEMKIEAMRREARGTTGNVGAELGEIQELLRREVLALRELMYALRPIELDSSEQLTAVLAAMVERFRRDTAISARFIAVGERVRFPPGKALEIVRIVQEALVNVRKHSKARNVLVRLSGDHGSYHLVIEDDGCGFGFDGRLSARELDARRLGPAIIKERARLAGAELAVDSTPGAGTRVELAFGEAAYG
jgi:signal transduction histidine kinase